MIKKYEILLKFAFFSMLLLFIFEITNSSFIMNLIEGKLSILKIIQISIFFCLTISLGFTSFSYKRIPLVIINFLKLRSQLIHQLLIYGSFQIILLCNLLIPSINPSAIIIRSRSFLVWLFTLSLIVFWIESSHYSLVRKKEKIVITSFLILDVLLLGYFFFFPNSIIFRTSSDYLTWNQGIFIFWLIFSLEFLMKFFRLKIEKHFFLILVCIFLYVMSGFLWGSIKFHGSYNMVGPFKPGDEWYPHSDSTRFDVASQSILIGEGINFHNYSDNPLMVFHMFFLHLLGGGSFNNLANIQVWIYSLIPIVLFFIGLKTSGFPCGLASSLFYIFRVCNFLSNTRNTGYVSPKIFLSEGLLEPIIMLIVLCLITLFSQKKNITRLVILLGGLFSLSALVRANVWFFLPLILILFFWISEWTKKIKLVNSAVFILSICIFLTPWMYRSSVTINTPFFFLYKYQHSILEERYDQQDDQINQYNLEKKFTYGNPLSVNKKSHSANDLFSLTFELISKINILQNILLNLIKNIWSSIRVIPNLSFQLSNWSFGIIISYLISGIILLIGFTSLYKSPNFFFSFLGVYFSYILASSFALTSGNRYSQPVEWIILIIYSMGINDIARISFNKLPIVKKKINNEGADKNFNELFKKNLLNFSILIILFLSIFVLLMDYYPKGQNVLMPKLDENKKDNIVNELCKKNSKGIIPAKIEGSGKIIYALSLRGDQIYDHEMFTEKPYLRPDEYDMLALFIINSDGGRWIRINMLQQDWPKESLVWKDIFYSGCENEKIVNVAYGIIYNKNNIYDLFKSNPKVTTP